MGQLADTAKKNSNFLKISKGESIIVKYISARIIPSTMDPTKETIQYKFHTEFGEKFWTNGNSKIMMLFDTIPIGTTVKITRLPWINKDGSEDTNKSTYEVSSNKTPTNVTSPEDIQHEV